MTAPCGSLLDLARRVLVAQGVDLADVDELAAHWKADEQSVAVFAIMIPKVTIPAVSCRVKVTHA